MNRSWIGRGRGVSYGRAAALAMAGSLAACLAAGAAQLTIGILGDYGAAYAGVAATNFSNYSTTCVDPSPADLLWTYQGYANSTVDRQWCTAWAAFKLSTAVVPTSARLPVAR